MLILFRSHRAESLIEALCGSLSTPRATLDVSADLILTPSAGMARWLQEQTAARLGVAANIDCPFPAEWLWRVIGQALPDVPAQSPFDPQALAWRVYRLLGASADQAPMQAVRAYLDVTDDTSRMQLAERIAGVFDRYLTYRNETWLARWAEGATVPGLPPAVAGWQASLWRAVLSDLQLTDTTHPLTRWLAWVDAHRHDEQALRGVLPERIRLFAVPALPPFYRRAFEALAAVVPVEWYALTPSREFFGDIVTERRRARVAAESPEAVGVYEVGNALLASLGRQAIDQSLQLIDSEDAGAEAIDRFDDEPADDTLLHTLQASIVELNDAPALTITTPEQSLQVHRCHSLVRQLDALHDELLRLFDALPDLQPADVLVMLPDLDAAAPAIDAVFGTAAPALALPYRISGRAQAEASPAANGLLSLLDVAVGRASAEAVLTLLRLPACAKRFGIDDAALARITDWLIAGGARWGWDADHRSRLGLPAEHRHSWAYWLERLVLAYAMPDQADRAAAGWASGDATARIDAPPSEQHVAANAAPLFAGIAPLAHVDSGQADIISALLRFIGALHQLGESLGTPRSAAHWAQTFSAAFEQFFAADETDLNAMLDRRALHQAGAAMADWAARGGCQAADCTIDFALARRLIAQQLERGAPGGLPTGAITFTRLGALRGAPYRVIALLGLDDGVFPRPGNVVEFDLLALRPQPGDPSSRDEDRGVFLDALMAARDVLWLGCNGRDPLDGGPLPPSIVIDELLDFIGGRYALGGDEARARIIRDHPLQAFSPRAFSADLRKPYAPEPSHVLEWLGAARAVRRPVEQKIALRLLCPQPLPPLQPPLRLVTIDQLTALLTHPARWFLRTRLQLDLNIAATALDEAEPFELARPDEWTLRDRIAAALPTEPSRPIDQAWLHALAFAHPELPHGEGGERALASILDIAAERAGKLAQLQQRFRPLVSLPVQLTIGEFSVEGVLSGVYGLHQAESGVIGAPTGQRSPYTRAQAWVAHLLHAAVTGRSGHTLWRCADGDLLLRPLDDAMAALQRLLDIYARALLSPPLCPAKTAWAFLEKSGKASVAMARREAERSTWRRTDSDFGNRPESDDPWWRTLIGEATDAVPDIDTIAGASSAFSDANFTDLAQWLYGDLHAALITDKKAIAAWWDDPSAERSRG